MRCLSHGSGDIGYCYDLVEMLVKHHQKSVADNIFDFGDHLNKFEKLVTIFVVCCSHELRFEVFEIFDDSFNVIFQKFITSEISINIKLQFCL